MEEDGLSSTGGRLCFGGIGVQHDKIPMAVSYFVMISSIEAFYFHMTTGRLTFIVFPALGF